MTYILSCLTPDYAIQVSDMRTTDFSTGKTASDTTVKTTRFNGQILFGFTGLGIIGGKPASQWLAAALSESLTAPVSKDVRMKWFADRLSDELERMVIHPSLRPREKAVKRVAVVGVGFAMGQAESLRPVYVCVSNFRGLSGEWLPEARPQCSVFAKSLRFPEPYVLYEAGYHLERTERRLLERTVAKAVRRADAGAIARLLAEQVRRVASRNDRVGKALLVSSLPVAKVPTRLGIRVGPPDFREPMFLYVPAGKHDGTFYAPNSATRQGALTGAVMKLGVGPPRKT